jgi:hypothetical protein
MKKTIFSIALLGVLSTLSAGVISQNGIATDSATSLMWQDDSEAKTNKKDWDNAKAYCENLTLGGFSDWRLQNIYELTTLLDNTKFSSQSWGHSTIYVIDGIENINSDSYWSSTTYADDTAYAWVVNFGNAGTSNSNKTSTRNVRCVRAGQLNFDNLVILKNKAKVKVSQINIDRITPNLAKIKAEKEEAKRIAEIKDYNQRKNIGDKICWVGRTSGWGLGITTESAIGFVENVSGNKIQIRIVDSNVSRLNGVSLDKNTILWDNYDHWKICY